MDSNRNQQHKSDNPNNPTCSPCLQALLDLQAVGIITKEQIAELTKDADRFAEADALFNKHQYPDSRTSFVQVNRDVEQPFESYLSANAVKIISVMLRNMRKGNLIELGIAECMLATGLAKATAIKALKELVTAGCIAVKFKRSKTHGTVYMVNPNLGVVGKNPNTSGLTYIFWNLTGDYKDSKGYLVKSAPHLQWVNNNTEIYTRGTDRQKVVSGQEFYFNKLNEGMVKLFKPSADAENSKKTVLAPTSTVSEETIKNINSVGGIPEGELPI